MSLIIQSDLLQTDTVKHDSVPLVIQPDTILPDSSVLNSVHDSTNQIEFKDSVSSPKEKNPPEKIISRDTTSGAKNFSFPSPDKKKDSLPVSPYLSSDTMVQSPDSAIVIINDTTEKIQVTEKKEEEFLIEQLRKNENSFWVLILFLVVFSVLAWVKVSYSKRLRQFFDAYLNNRYIRQLLREEFVFSHPVSVALSGIYLVTGSLLLLKANSCFHWNFFTDTNSADQSLVFLVFIKILAAIAFFYFSKIFLIRLSAKLFSANQEINEYLFNLILFNNILGFLFLPLATLVVFSNVFSERSILLFSGGMALLSFLFRIVKCFYIGSSTTKFSIWYIILYICTLEFLPLIIVIKALTGRS